MNRIIGLAVLAAAAVPAPSPARAADFGFALGPLVGLEWLRTESPSPHHPVRTLGGFMVIAGYRGMSAEFRFMRGFLRDTDPSVPLSVKDVASQYQMGVRSAIPLGKMTDLNLRFGFMIRNSLHEEVSGAVSTVNPDRTEYRGYGGIGMTLLKAGPLEFPLGYEMVVHSVTDVSRNDSRVFGGILIRLK